MKTFTAIAVGAMIGLTSIQANAAPLSTSLMRNACDFNDGSVNAVKSYRSTVQNVTFHTFFMEGCGGGNHNEAYVGASVNGRVKDTAPIPGLESTKLKRGADLTRAFIYPKDHCNVGFLQIVGKTRDYNEKMQNGNITSFYYYNGKLEEHLGGCF